MKIVLILIIFARYILLDETGYHVFITFLIIRRNCVIFFTNAIFGLTHIEIHKFLLIYLRRVQFSYTTRGNFPDDFMSLNKIHNFHTPR